MASSRVFTSHQLSAFMKHIGCSDAIAPLMVADRRLPPCEYAVLQHFRAAISGTWRQFSGKTVYSTDGDGVAPLRHSDRRQSAGDCATISRFAHMLTAHRIDPMLRSNCRSLNQSAGILLIIAASSIFLMANPTCRRWRRILFLSSAATLVIKN